MKKAVVTGGAGFIGSHLVDKLLEQGFDVHVIDNLSSGNAEAVNKRAKLYPLDIRSAGAQNMIIREKPDVVFHLAAQVDVQKSILDPQNDADINIRGLINLLEACVSGSAGKIIFASSCAVYGDLQKPLISEEDETIPASYYGISKLTSEMYIRVFHSLYGLPYTNLRFANVFGPRQSKSGEGGVVAIFLDRLKKKLPLIIYGDGEQTRDFVYVDDIVAALTSAIDNGNGKTFNIGTSQAASVNVIASHLQNLANVQQPIQYEPAKKGDIRHSCLQNQLAKQELGWSPNFTLITGLEATHRLYFSH